MYEQDDGFDGMRNELLSRGTAVRGGVSKDSGGPWVQKSGRACWSRGSRIALCSVACLKCRKVGQSVVKK